MFLMNSPTKLPVALKKIKTKVMWRGGGGADKFVPFLCLIIIIVFFYLSHHVMKLIITDNHFRSHHADSTSLR